MIIEQIKDELETLETIDFKELSQDQKKMLRDKYNFFTTGFQYGVDDWGNVKFICSNDTFRNMEYYLGLEYERDEIEYKLEFNNKIIVSYEGSERVENFLEQLQGMEEEFIEE
jgi:hypothetical protein